MYTYKFDWKQWLRDNPLLEHGPDPANHCMAGAGTGEDRFREMRIDGGRATPERSGPALLRVA